MPIIVAAGPGLLQTQLRRGGVTFSTRRGRVAGISCRPGRRYAGQSRQPSCDRCRAPCHGEDIPDARIERLATCHCMEDLMAGSVIVAGARTPIGRLLGGLKDLAATDLGGVAIKGALEKSGVARRPGRLRDHGPGAAGRRRPDPGSPGRGQGRHPDGRVPATHHQQGVPVGRQRDRARRPADPRRRVRGRRRRRHGVDDQRAAPDDEVARGLQVRRRHGARPHGVRRTVGRLHRPGDGQPHRGSATPTSRR